MLQIRLNKGSVVDSGSGAKSLPTETVMVACPDHLVLADLLVAKGLGSAVTASIVKTVGRRSRRQLGERAHFCVRCDFPIAVYGRLSPCEHVFCLDCARSDSICYLCDERIQKIQTIKLMEGIFICAAPHCLKSFMKKSEFESHIHDSHADLLQPNMKEEMIEPEASGTKQSSTLDTTLRGPPRMGFSPSSNSQPNEREDKPRRQQPREQTPLRPVVQPKPPQYYAQSHPSEPQTENRSISIDGSVHFRMQQQNLDMQGGGQQDFGQFSDKQQQGITTPDPHREYPSLYPQQMPTFPTPVNSNSGMLTPHPFGFPPFPSDGGPPFYGGPVPYDGAQSESAMETGPEGYSKPWSVPPGNVPFENRQTSQGMMQGMPPPPPPPGPPPRHMVHQKHGYYSDDISNDGKNYGWKSDRRDGFGSSQD